MLFYRDRRCGYQTTLKRVERLCSGKLARFASNDRISWADFIISKQQSFTFITNKIPLMNHIGPWRGSVGCDVTKERITALGYPADDLGYDDL
jgi:hypothetical protein